MAAAVVELNSLPDSIWSAPQDDDLLLRRGRRLIFLFVGGVQIRRVAFELCSARIHKLEDGLDPICRAQVANLFGSTLGIAHLPQVGETRVRNTHTLGFANNLRRSRI